MSTREAYSARPWYREVWPWLLMLPPAGAVAGGIAMIYLALHTSSDLVVSDYARIEEITEQRFARDARAVELGLAARVALVEPAPGRAAVTVTLDGREVPNVVRLELQHAARHELDTAVTLGHLPNAAENVYSGELELAPGHYELELGPLDQSWRLAGALGALPATLELRPQGAPSP
jgi:hypothetical protein